MMMRRRHGDRGGDGHQQSGGDNNNTAVLSFDALFVMMEYLHPRDLLNTALTCKTLLDMVTTKLVVRSALIHGAYNIVIYVVIFCFEFVVLVCFLSRGSWSVYYGWSCEGCEQPLWRQSEKISDPG